MEGLNQNISPTVKEYLEDSYKFETAGAKLLKIEEIVKDKDNNSIGLIFDKTVFHPQGGGQPSDEGIITKQGKDNNEIGDVNVTGLMYDRERDIVIHKISKDDLSKFDIKVDDIFNMKINNEKRILYARLHSAGHLLDISVAKLGLNLVPGKGYHFPDGPYVEYAGLIDKNSINSTIENLNKISQEIIDEAEEENKSFVKLFDYEDGKKEFGNIPDYLPKDKPFRWVKLTQDDLGCPCGGTHVKHIRDIQNIKISKITAKGKLVRFSYNVI